MFLGRRFSLRLLGRIYALGVLGAVLCIGSIAQEPGGRSNSTALVGTPEQVAEAFLDYHALGVTTFLIRGFDPLEDALEYGRDLIPLVREATAARATPRAVGVG